MMLHSKKALYLLVAILNFAATGHQGGLRTCSWWFLADRTIGRAYGTVCRLSSVCLSVCL